ncbi:hypothetical protein [Thermococcus piezophilus]|uniref:hypothetical protein n=1 Tax=Thermococcus piezophilus TaxID=1712654 RepID=UPI000A64C01A|nr:hypothetical protein [Thermococcus piezophilus]
MKRLKSTLLQKRLQLVRERKKMLLLEEARLVRLSRQKKIAAEVLSKVRKEKFQVLMEEARLIRTLKQSGYPAV